MYDFRDYWENRNLFIYCDIEGGAASGPLPQAMFGRGPISRTIVPPLTISLCSNQGLFSGLPFSVADWIYLFTAETFLALIVNTFPSASVSLTSSKIGLPMSYTGRPGQTGKKPIALNTYQDEVSPLSSSPG